ncbi:hypothetical protein B738_26932 [Photorhabdus temperata subsp. temperata M1021]|uniref:Uncharacterized protein n=1 Tax=Photorhabdus temperata J3 TaxID=1389415 RepID=U7R5W3_PHOTE|nr:hypothetical protein B738_26932 [Photorhabdus temperata subsp. temperata M1021]ERT14832.1 hypothetical protein O185_01490 [Photorhabdus temperata J3]
MKCGLKEINAGSFAGIVGLRPALVAVIVGRKCAVNAGPTIYKCGLLQIDGRGSTFPSLQARLSGPA